VDSKTKKFITGVFGKPISEQMVQIASTGKTGQLRIEEIAHPQNNQQNFARIMPTCTPGMGDTCIHGGYEQHGF
jgi:hypothetical protein